MPETGDIPRGDGVQASGLRTRDLNVILEVRADKLQRCLYDGPINGKDDESAKAFADSHSGAIGANLLATDIENISQR